MANIARIKKTKQLAGVVSDAAPSEKWEERLRTTSWDQADAMRSAIINETQRSARLRWVGSEYVVEWRS